MNFLFRRLGPSDSTLYRKLRLQGLRDEPAAFGSSFEEESIMSMAVFTQRLEQTIDKWSFGAFSGAKLIGAVTVVRDGQRKSRHKAGVYGMYVAPRFRRLGVGRGLLTLAVSTADQMPGLKQVRLSVGSANRAALRLYLSAGFSEYGRERDALCVGGRFHTEALLVRRVKPGLSGKGPTQRRPRGKYR